MNRSHYTKKINSTDIRVLEETLINGQMSSYDLKNVFETKYGLKNAYPNANKSVRKLRDMSLLLEFVSAENPRKNVYVPHISSFFIISIIHFEKIADDITIQEAKEKLSDTTKEQIRSEIEYQTKAIEPFKEFNYVFKNWNSILELGKRISEDNEDKYFKWLFHCLQSNYKACQNLITIMSLEAIEARQSTENPEEYKTNTVCKNYVSSFFPHKISKMELFDIKFIAWLSNDPFELITTNFTSFISTMEDFINDEFGCKMLKYYYEIQIQNCEPKLKYYKNGLEELEGFEDSHPNP